LDFSLESLEMDPPPLDPTRPHLDHSRPTYILSLSSHTITVMARAHISNDEVCRSLSRHKQVANFKTVLHSAHQDDGAEATKRPRIRLPHSKTPYVRSHATLPSQYLTAIVTYDQTAAKSPSEKVPGNPLSDLHPTLPLPMIMRASDGETQSKDRVKNKDHVNISTIVQPDDLETFFTRYAEVCKATMLSLRKRDRRKRKGDKSKKKKGAETVEKKV
jgi:signal recognition particle subunit SRP14